MAASDPRCDSLGIPRHLHRMQREAVISFWSDELLFRRYPAGKDLAESISFHRKNSSTNRSAFCKSADDALWKCEEGGRYEGFGVLSLPAAAFENKSWQTDEKQPAVYTLHVFHCPTLCNYPHSDFRIFKDGIETDKIKPGSVKLKIRQYLVDSGLIKSEIDP